MSIKYKIWIFAIICLFLLVTTVIAVDIFRLGGYYDIIPPTFSNNRTNATSTYPRYADDIQLNITLSEGGELDYYILAHNATGELINGTPVNISGTSFNMSENITISNLTRGDTFEWHVWVNDTAGFINHTSFLVEIKNTIPTVPVHISPIVDSSTDKTFIVLQYNSTDPDNSTDTMYFWIYNSTDDLTFSLLFYGVGYENSTYNWTGLADGDYYWKVMAGDSYGNSSISSSFKLTVSTSLPAITLEWPRPTGVHLNNQTVEFNFTATDSNNISVCQLWTNETTIWSMRQAIPATSGVETNFSKRTLTDQRSYIWNVWCSDTGGNSQFYGTNFIVSIDTLPPVVTLHSPISTSYTSLSLLLDHTETDFSLSYCRYSFNGTAPRGNTTVTCNTDETITIPVYGSYTFDYYVTDDANNVNHTQVHFSISAPPPDPGGPGGPSEPAPPEVNVTQAVGEALEEAVICGNGVCQKGENPISCPQDCPVNVDELFCFLGTKECAAWVFNVLIYGILGTVMFVTFRRQRKGQ